MYHSNKTEYSSSCTELQNLTSNMQSNNSVISQSLSFDTYSSSNRLAQIAARVVHEFQPSSDLHTYLSQNPIPIPEEESNKNDDDELKEYHEEKSKKNEEDDDDFEFASLSREEPDLSSIPADQIYYNGQIRPAYPLFNTKLLFSDDDDVPSDRNFNSLSPPTMANTTSPSSPVRLPLRKLFTEERERDSPSCSSSEADELDRVPAEMYCVWKPKTAEKSPESCKKSNSTGSSKRWNKFRDLLYRSNSEGKDSFVFLASSNKKREASPKVKKVPKEASRIRENGKANRLAVAAGETPVTLESRLRKEKVEEKDQRRTNVPTCKKDIVGLFANVNGVSRNLHPF